MSIEGVYGIAYDLGFTVEGGLNTENKFEVSGGIVANAQPGKRRNLQGGLSEPEGELCLVEVLPPGQPVLLTRLHVTPTCDLTRKLQGIGFSDFCESFYDVPPLPPGISLHSNSFPKTIDL